jgi:hypothetical protein
LSDDGPRFIGGPFQRLVLSERWCTFSATLRLLRHVSQLVAQQAQARTRVRRILLGRKCHVPAYCVCLSLDRPGGLGRLRVGVHPHLAEVLPKAGFHAGTGRRIQGPAG